MSQLHFVTVAECKYVTEESQLVFLSERTKRKRNHLHFASGSKCRWNDQMQEITVMNCRLLLPATRNANDRVPQSKVPSCISGVELIGDCVLIVGACTMHAGLQGRHFFILLSYIGSNHVVVSLAI